MLNYADLNSLGERPVPLAFLDLILRIRTSIPQKMPQTMSMMGMSMGMPPSMSLVMGMPMGMMWPAPARRDPTESRGG